MPTTPYDLLQAAGRNAVRGFLTDEALEQMDFKLAMSDTALIGTVSPGENVTVTTSIEVSGPSGLLLLVAAALDSGALAGPATSSESAASRTDADLAAHEAGADADADAGKSGAKARRPRRTAAKDAAEAPAPVEPVTEPTPEPETASESEAETRAEPDSLTTDPWVPLVETPWPADDPAPAPAAVPAGGPYTSPDDDF